MRLKELRQAKADNDAAQAALKNEGRTLLAKKDRTDPDATRLDAIDVELAILVEAAVTITKDIAREERYAAAAVSGAVPAMALVVGKNVADEQPITFGQFMQAVAYSAPGMGHKAAEAGFVWTDALRASVTGASSGVSQDGGVLVRNEWSTALLNKTRESSQLQSKCRSIPIGDGFDGIEAPYVNETSRATGSRWGGVRVYRAAEAAEVTASKPALGKFELRLEDMKGLFYATDRVLRDATALQGISEDAFSSEFAFKLDDEIFRGTGTGQCLGILNADCKVQVAKEGSQAADTILSQNIIKMYNRMLARSMPRAEWYINQETLEQLHQMYLAVGTAGGQLTYMPPSGLASAPYGTLMGRPVNVLEVASGLGDAGDIVFADFSEYLLISKPMSSASSMHVRFIYDEMTFRWTWPIIGKPLLASAITPYKATTATTLSPFITLQAR